MATMPKTVEIQVEVKEFDRVELAKQPPCYRRILTAFYSTPLALLPAKIEEIRHFLLLKASGGDVAPEQVAAVQAARRNDGVQMAGRVAIVPVQGVIAQRMNMMDEMSGGVSTESLAATLEGLVNDRTVKAIVMAFDSPGGSVFGVQELGDKIRGWRDQKKIVGIADSTAASAAYWLLSQCSEINVTPGGMVGSVGVYAAHVDATKMAEQLGLRTTLVSSTPAKVELAPEVALTDEARNELQQQVNQYYQTFLGAVAKGRGVTQAQVEKNFGGGRMVLAKDAVERGMADRVSTMDQVLKRLGAGDGGNGAAAMSTSTGNGAEGQVPVAAGQVGEDVAADLDQLAKRTRAYECALAAEQAQVPQFGAFVHNSKTSSNEPDWGSVDKTKLPRLAFADPGEPDKKSTWGYPHHWVQNGGNEDENGVYTTGTMWLHRQGLNAAWSAAMGGRSGQKASQEVIDHLQAHRKALGLTD